MPPLAHGASVRHFIASAGELWLKIDWRRSEMKASHACCVRCSKNGDGAIQWCAAPRLHTACRALQFADMKKGASASYCQNICGWLAHVDVAFGPLEHHGRLMGVRVTASGCVLSAMKSQRSVSVPGRPNVGSAQTNGHWTWGNVCTLKRRRIALHGLCSGDQLNRPDHGVTPAPRR